MEETRKSAPAPRFDVSVLDESFVTGVRERILARAELRDLVDAMRESLRTDRTARGYLVIDGAVHDPSDTENALVSASMLGCLLGRPFRMVTRLPMWQELGVREDVAPHRFGGLGYNPLHIDGVNTTNPPDYLMLLCLRSDPAGGGASLVSNLQDVADRLTAEDRAFLQERRFVEGQFYDLEGVGSEYKPFPVLERREDGLWWVRATGKMLPEMQDGPEKDAVARLIGLLEEHREAVALEPGQLIIVNQILVAHGREPLGEQSAVPTDERRYFRQGFVRAAPGAITGGRVRPIAR